MKILKIILLTFNVLVLLVIFIFVCVSKKPMVEKNYVDKVATGGDIEAQYIKTGIYEVSRAEIGAMQSFKKYEFYYPTEMVTSNNKFPVVIFSNGTGVGASKYSATLKHLASYGFVVAATEEEYSWNGFSSEMCFQTLIRLNATERINNWETNPFYKRIDFDNIGAAGHSQGGVGVINAITNERRAQKYKAAFCASPTNKDLAYSLDWRYDATKISVPIMLVSSVGSGDENLVVSKKQLQSIYNDVPISTPKIMFRRTDADHGDMLYYADGYMTAWFAWQLQGDESASKAFRGNDAEIYGNPYYQDIASNLN